MLSVFHCLSAYTLPLVIFRTKLGEQPLLLKTSSKQRQAEVDYKRTYLQILDEAGVVATP